ncbi:unnamed protein product, partial [Ectocarpus sp. 12 AP-2014]
VFQQNNDPKHILYFVINWLQDNNVQLLDSPSQLPYLNSIKHLWDSLKMEIGSQNFENLSNLFSNLKKK